MITRFLHAIPNVRFQARASDQLRRAPRVLNFALLTKSARSYLVCIARPLLSPSPAPPPPLFYVSANGDILGDLQMVPPQLLRHICRGVCATPDCDAATIPLVIGYQGSTSESRAVVGAISEYDGSKRCSALNLRKERVKVDDQSINSHYSDARHNEGIRANPSFHFLDVKCHSPYHRRRPTRRPIPNPSPATIK